MEEYSSSPPPFRKLDDITSVSKRRREAQVKSYTEKGSDSIKPDQLLIDPECGLNLTSLSATTILSIADMSHPPAWWHISIHDQVLYDESVYLAFTSGDTVWLHKYAGAEGLVSCPRHNGTYAPERLAKHHNQAKHALLQEAIKPATRQQAKVSAPGYGLVSTALKTHAVRHTDSREAILDAYSRAAATMGSISDPVEALDYLCQVCKGPEAPTGNKISSQTKVQRVRALCDGRKYGKALAVLEGTEGEPPADPVSTAQALHPSNCDNIGGKQFPETPIHDMVPAFSPFTEADLDKAMNALNKNSAPGPSGLTAKMLEQILANIPVLKLNLVKGFNAIIETSKCPASFLAFTLVLLPKGNGKFRPIAMAELLQKLLHTMLYHKLIWLEKYLGTAQHAFKKDAYIKCVTSFEKLMAIGGLTAISLDIRNAFNSVPFTVISKAMAKYKIDYRIVTYLEGMIRTRRCQYDIQIAKGVPQGDPLSMLLFCLCIAPVLAKLPGVPIAYADDVVLLIPKEADAIVAMMQCKALFLRMCGLELAVEKCKTVNDPGFEFMQVKFTPEGKALSKADQALAQLKQRTELLIKTPVDRWHKWQMAKLCIIPAATAHVTVDGSTQDDWLAVERQILRLLAHLFGSIDSDRVIAPPLLGGLGLIMPYFMYPLLRSSKEALLAGAPKPSLTKLRNEWLKDRFAEHLDGEITPMINYAFLGLNQLSDAEFMFAGLLWLRYKQVADAPKDYRCDFCQKDVDTYHHAVCKKWNSQAIAKHDCFAINVARCLRKKHGSAAVQYVDQFRTDKRYKDAPDLKLLDTTVLDCLWVSNEARMEEKYRAKIQKYQHYETVIPLAVSARLVFHPMTKEYLRDAGFFKTTYLSEVAVMSARHFAKTKSLSTIDEVKAEERRLSEIGLGKSW